MNHALSPAERRVVERVARGHTIARTARALDLQPGSVKSNLKRAASRLGVPSTRGVPNQAAVIHAAYRTGNLTNLPPEPRQPVTLTPELRQVLRALAAGSTTANIARDVGLSPKKVETHLAVLHLLLEADSRAHLVALAHQHGHLTATEIAGAP